MMVWSLLAALAFAAPTTSVPFERPLAPPGRTFDGSFDSPPAMHWVVNLPGQGAQTASHNERARPVLVGADIFVGSASGDALYRLARRDGRLLQSYAADASVETEPLLVDDRVVFSDTAGSTWCYKLDGSFVWKHQSGAPILVRPTLAHGQVVVTNVNDLAFALDVITGELSWRYQEPRLVTRESELTLFAAPPAAIVGDELVMGFSDGTIVGLVARTGERRWQRTVGEGRYPDIVAGVVAAGDVVLASGYFKPLVAIDATTHDVRWRAEFGAANQPLIGDGVMYHPGTDGELRAIDTRTGEVVWTWASGTEGALTTPVLTDAGLIVASSEGDVYLVNPADGVERWRFHERFSLDGVTSAPAVAGRQMVFSSNAGRLYSMVVPRSVARAE